MLSMMAPPPVPEDRPRFLGLSEDDEAAAEVVDDVEVEAVLWFEEFWKLKSEIVKNNQKID